MLDYVYISLNYRTYNRTFATTLSPSLSKIAIAFTVYKEASYDKK